MTLLLVMIFPVAGALVLGFALGLAARDAIEDGRRRRACRSLGMRRSR